MTALDLNAAQAIYSAAIFSDSRYHSESVAYAGPWSPGLSVIKSNYLFHNPGLYYERTRAVADLTPTQGRYLAYIHAYTEGFGLPPAESELAAAIGASPPSVNQMMKALEKKALIRRQPGVPRSIEILIAVDAIPIEQRHRSKRLKESHDVLM